MSDDINASVNSDALQNFYFELLVIQSAMQYDINDLRIQYARSSWDDAVSEKVRDSINQYIKRYNDCAKQLHLAITAIEQMRDALDEYKKTVE